MVAQKKHHLVVVDGLNIGESYILQDARCTIGRASDNVIVINTPSISRYHAQITLTFSGPQIEDLNSTNGTYVNGGEITRPVILRSGDRVSLADASTLQYTLEEDDATEYMGSASGAATVIEPSGDAYTPPPPAMEYTPPPPPKVAPEPAPAYQEISFNDAPQVNYAPPAGTPPPPPAVAPINGDAVKPKRPTWIYVVIGILLILICLCVAAAAYMWFAPPEFWEKVFDLLGIPLPTGLLLTLL